MSDLPSCSPGLLAEIVDKTPNRLRKKLDRDPAAARAWEWSREGDRWSIRIDDETSVTLNPADGVIRGVDQVQCTCLLFPRCFHLMAVLDHLPIAAEAIGDSDTLSEGDDKPEETDAPVRDDATALSAEQSACASRCFEIGATLLHMGAGSAGAVFQVDLLRAIHTARVAGLHRLGASGLRMLSLIKEHRSGDSSFSLPDLREEMNEFLTTAMLLEQHKEACAPALIGTARRVYRPSGNFFLYGLASEAVISRKGMVGVVTHLMDADHHLYSLPSILPEELRDIENAYNGGVDLGDLVCSHRELVRHGVHVHNAAVSDDGALGRGKKVNAVLAGGNVWDSDFFRSLFETSPKDQLEKIFENREKKRFTPFCFTAVVTGSLNGAPVVAESVSGARLFLLPPSDRHETARRNLTLLSAYKGLHIRCIGTPIPRKAGCVIPIVIGATPGFEDEFHFPAEWAGRFMPSLEILDAAYILADKNKNPMQAPQRRDDVCFEYASRHLTRMLITGRHGISSKNSAIVFRDMERLKGVMLKRISGLLGSLAAACLAPRFDSHGKRIHENHGQVARRWLAVDTCLKYAVEHYQNHCWKKAVE